MELKKLSEIGSIFNGNSINAKLKKEKYLNIENGIPYIATKDVSYESRIAYNNGIKIPFLEKTNFKVAPKDTVLICAEGGSAGRKIGYTNQEVCFGNKLFAFSANNNIESKYVYHYYFSDAFQKAFKSQMTGIIGGVSMNKFKNLEIPLPPLPQQKQIVATLDKAFTAINKAKANAEQNLQNTKELFESYLQISFLNNISGTNFSKLNEICELIVDCEHKTAPIQDSGYPSIRTPNIGKGKLILKGVNRVSEETYKLWTRRAIPQSGDLILAREAPAGNIGVIPTGVKVCLGQRTVLIRPKKDKFIPEYLAFLILSKDVQKELLSHSTGATVQHINMKDIRAFKIYNLPDISDQQIIVDKIKKVQDKTGELEYKYTQKLKDLEELKKSILQKAFSGQLNTIN